VSEQSPAPAPATTVVEPSQRPSGGLASRLLSGAAGRNLGLIIALLLLIVVGWITAGSTFMNFENMLTIIRFASIIGVISIGMTFVICGGGIDLSVGAIVSLAGMIFGFAYGEWGWGLIPAILLTAAFGALCGALNGFLVAYVGFPALIATLATFYGFKSLAIVINNQSPISTPPIQNLFSITRSVELPVFGAYVPDVPLGLFTFLLPTVLVVWLLLARTTYGRRLYAVGTNDVAGRWAGIPVRGTRFKAYVYAGLISGLVAVVTVAQFASARPDAGVSGNGMALPAITIAVLGGVAITGGIGRVAGVVLATLLIVWLNAGILLAFVGNEGSQYQLLALGAVLIFAALLNGLTTRRYGGSR